MSRYKSATAAILALVLLSACAGTGGAKPASSAKPNPSASFDKNPYPSTYKPYPGAPVALVGATVFDGAGARIENGTVLLRDGKVVGIGGADLTIPDGFTRIDGTGKFVTPGIIDIHSHLGDYPSPGVQANSDGNEATDPTTPNVWAEHSVWPQDPGFTRAMANGGITALQILPGSANLMGGRSVMLKNVPSRTVQGMKFPGEVVMEWLTLNPARALGIDKQTGSLATGKMADVVLWNGNPLSVYSRPEKVWVDGALLFDADDPKRRAVSDFELGQPGEGDVK